MHSGSKIKAERRPLIVSRHVSCNPTGWEFSFSFFFSTPRGDKGATRIIKLGSEMRRIPFLPLVNLLVETSCWGEIVYYRTSFSRMCAKTGEGRVEGERFFSILAFTVSFETRRCVASKRIWRMETDISSAPPLLLFSWSDRSARRFPSGKLCYKTGEDCPRAATKAIVSHDNEDEEQSGVTIGSEKTL